MQKKLWIVSAFLETQDLQSQIEIAEGEIADLEVSRTALTAEIARLKEQEGQFRKTLEIMQSESPILEVLNALEAHMERGVGANSIRFVSGAREDKTVFYTVTVDASAATEEQIIALTDGLSGNELFSTVTMPSTKKDEKTGTASMCCCQPASYSSGTSTSTSGAPPQRAISSCMRANATGCSRLSTCCRSPASANRAARRQGRSMAPSGRS